MICPSLKPHIIPPPCPTPFLIISKTTELFIELFNANAEDSVIDTLASDQQFMKLLDKVEIIYIIKESVMNK